MYYYWDDEKISEHRETLVVTLLIRIEELQVMNRACNLELEQVKKERDQANLELEASKDELAALKAKLAMSKEAD